MGSLLSRVAPDERDELTSCVCVEEEEEEEEEEEDEEDEEEEEEDRLPYLCSRPLPSEEVRDGQYMSKAHAALHYYNSSHPGEEYDLVKPLMSASVFFKHRMWHHISFLARRSGQVAPPVEYFFAELRGDRPTSFIVEACTMIENPQSCSGNKCTFCPRRYGTVHPSEQKLLCGKEEDVKDINRLMNFAPLPFTCPVTVPEIDIVIEK